MAVTGAGGRLEIGVDGITGAAGVTLVPAARARGWMSRSYAERLPALGLCLSCQAGLPVQVTTRFSYRDA